MTDSPQPITTTESTERRAYSAPEIVHELKLETRAGSTLRPGLSDPLGVDPTQPKPN